MISMRKRIKRITAMIDEIDGVELEDITINKHVCLHLKVRGKKVKYFAPSSASDKRAELNMRSDIRRMANGH